MTINKITKIRDSLRSELSSTFTLGSLAVQEIYHYFGSSLSKENVIEVIRQFLLIVPEDALRWKLVIAPLNKLGINPRSVC